VAVMKTNLPSGKTCRKKWIASRVLLAPLLCWLLLSCIQGSHAEAAGKEAPVTPGKKTGTSGEVKKAAPQGKKLPAAGTKKVKPGTSGTTAVKKEKTAEKKPVNDDAARRASEKKRAKMIGETIDFGIQKDRLIAVTKILNIKEKDIKNELLEKCTKVLETETDLEVTIKIITIIGESDYRKAIPVIIKKLDDRTEDVRVAAVYALEKMEAKSARQKLVSILKSSDLSVDTNLTEALINTLGEFRAGELTDFAMKSIKDVKTTRNNRHWLVLYLGKTGNAGSVKFLTGLYLDEDEDVTVRAYAVNSLAKIGAKSATGDIRRIVTEIDSYPVKKKRQYYNLYMYSVAALARLGDSEALPRLMNSMRSNSSAVRLKAVRLIREMKDKRTIDILKYKMNYDPSAKVRSAAKEALKELGVSVEDEKESKSDGGK